MVTFSARHRRRWLKAWFSPIPEVRSLRAHPASAFPVSSPWYLAGFHRRNEGDAGGRGFQPHSVYCQVSAEFTAAAVLFPVCFDGPSLKPIRSLGHKCAHVKARRTKSAVSTAVQCPLERHLHVPGETTAPVKLPAEDAAHFGVEGRIHETLHSIGSAMTLRGGFWIHRSSHIGLTPPALYSPSRDRKEVSNNQKKTFSQL